MAPSGDDRDPYWDELIPKFEKIYGNKPEIAVRCPGRVNLIGEHVDYSGYSVLPMAIKQSTYVLIRKNGTNNLNFANTDPDYENYSHDTSIEWLGTTTPKWYHYFLCGWKGAKEQLGISQTLLNNGLDILLSGKIPPSSGLSSSSSLVCAAFLSTMSSDTKINPNKIDRLSLADSSARVERYIGVEGGGMDQAIECLAENGKALKIDFNPLFFTKVNLPKNAIFAIIHSGKYMNKASTNFYNIRVVECRLAAQIIAKRLNHHNWREIRTLKHLSEFLTKDPDEMIKVIERHFDEEYFERNEILSELEIDDLELIEYSLNETTKNLKKFKLRDRSMHVFTESQRVQDFKLSCENNNLNQMGKLMILSHESCKNLFECSCQELDDTVQNCLNNGFIGARLTGAGWGGCVVALADENKKDEISKKIDVLFWTEPASGIQLEYL